MPIAPRHRLALLLPLVSAAPAAMAGPVAVPLVAAAWHAPDTAHFLVREGFPHGLLQLDTESEEGYARFDGATFSDGTIEFDIKPQTDEMPGIRFRQGADGSADMLYIRVGPNCPAAQDCLQYLPLTATRILWDMYPQYQAAAPVQADAWNHVRLVIAGRRMQVFVNRQLEPSLVVEHLEGDHASGAIALEGKAQYANLTLDAAATGLPAPREPVASPTDEGLLTDWEVAGTGPLGHPGEPAIADAPASGWQPLATEAGGLVNLARRFAATQRGAARQYAWLRTRLVAGKAQAREVAIGYLREATVFVNGKPVFSGKNLYNVPGARQAPDGRLDLRNGHFSLPLQQGRNDIVVAIDANTPDMRGRYGWGLKMKVDGRP
ncbi:hypothetical protein [Luteibacter yeojuensis]|uniref:3-keto-disaccharide hydrolase domain-containing protein n=1 Tax=Luteibacter yeojuensis TaxID=345309 RepID=A0A0F3KNE5_9GAMM|nr:hypothetical protein [Luteibacter yeojuensis]KJV32507.1 hypothetical protein VI08_12280 [Luteibacter yeojuensis]